MSKYLGILCLMAVSFSTFAQSNGKAEIQSALDKYFQYNQDQDLDGIMKMVNPKLFNLISKDQMRQTLQMTFGNPQFKIEMSDFEAGEVSEVYELNGEKFAVVEYNHQMDFNFPEPNEATISTMKQALMGQNGISGVEVSDDMKQMSAAIEKVLWAYQPKDENSWYFSDHDESNMALMAQLIPEEAIQHFFPE